jgi:23S rRNA (uracil1939-C5)-methyltransferase
MTLRAGSELIVPIVDLAVGGRGVARVDGFVLFVAGALQGETARVRVDRVRRGFAEGTAVAILQPSPDRAIPPCEHYDACGGCDLQHLAVPAQAEAKRAQVASLLKRIAGLQDVDVPPAVLSPLPFGYRFRMDFDWRASRSGPILGLHRRGRPDAVVPIRRCLLTTDTVNEMIAWLSREAAARRLAAFDPRSRRGLLRRASFQEARGTGERLVTLETGRGEPGAMAQLAAALTRRFPGTVGVVRLEQGRGGVAEIASILAGRDFLYEDLEGDRFRIPAEAFFQPNPSGSLEVRRHAVEALGLSGRGSLLELYCGVGVFTLLAARKTSRIVAVEASPIACAAARDNAARAGATQCRFVTSDVEAALPELLREAWEAVLLDPPRVGLPRAAALALAADGPRRIVYVSCDPATLARDLSILSGSGRFRVLRVTPHDLFPQTHHVECVAELERG